MAVTEYLLTTVESYHLCRCKHKFLFLSLVWKALYGHY